MRLSEHELSVCWQVGFGEDSSSELPSITDVQTDGEESDRVSGSRGEGGMREKRVKEELLLSKGRGAHPLSLHDKSF